MADSFIGMTVSVKLKPPANPPVLIGKVVSLHDQTLVLNHVFLPLSGQTAPTWSIPSFQIADLEVTNSMGHQPQPVANTPSRQPAPVAPQAAPLNVIPPPSAQTVLTPSVLSPAKPPLAAPVAGLATPSKQRTIASFLQTPNGQSAKNGTQTQAAKKGKGWRQTPLLEEAIQSAQLQVPSDTLPVRPKTAVKKSRRARDEQQAQHSGWATEEATDVQDMGDFDFAANLSKFDKKAVFDELRNDDIVAEGDRLVSHNRIARPGTAGGKNLHPTEMVLSPSIKPTVTQQDPESSASSDLDMGNGRSSRQSQRSKTRIQPLVERKASGAMDDRSRTRPLRSISSQQRPLNASVLSSASLNLSTSSFYESHDLPAPSGAYLRNQANALPCPTVAPERLDVAMANYAAGPYLGWNTLLELTASALARAVSSNTPRPQESGRRTSKTATARSQKPVIVLLVGMHYRGTQAIAAARHLFGKDYRLLIADVDIAVPGRANNVYADQLSLLQTILKQSRRPFAHVDSWPAINAQIKKLKAPPALIVDALLDGESYGDIKDVQKAIEVREMIDWSNRSRAPVISIECPSGYDEASGETTVVEGEPVAVKPDRVLALGAVLQGVFEAMVEGETWSLSVLDVGLSSQLTGEEAVKYGPDWSVELEFVQGE